MWPLLKAVQSNCRYEMQDSEYVYHYRDQHRQPQTVFPRSSPQGIPQVHPAPFRVRQRSLVHPTVPLSSLRKGLRVQYSGNSDKDSRHTATRKEIECDDAEESIHITDNFTILCDDVSRVPIGIGEHERPDP